MANTVYENKVIASKATNILETSLNTRTLMTVDTSLQGNEGMTKTINTYTYKGTAEEVEEGKGNTSQGAVTFKGKDYKVKVVQQAFGYTDEDFMKDSQVVDFGVKGATSVMANFLNGKYFDAIGDELVGKSEYTGALTYDAVVDAIASMNIEDESGLFLLINPALKAEIRKDADYKAAQMGEVVYNGQIGTIAGIPVVVSKSVENATLATKEAVTLFIKKEVEVEQDRDADLRQNLIYLREVYIIALTDATKACKLTKKVGA